MKDIISLDMIDLIVCDNGVVSNWVSDHLPVASGEFWHRVGDELRLMSPGYDLGDYSWVCTIPIKSTRDLTVDDVLGKNVFGGTEFFKSPLAQHTKKANLVSA